MLENPFEQSSMHKKSRKINAPRSERMESFMSCEMTIKGMILTCGDDFVSDGI